MDPVNLVHLTNLMKAAQGSPNTLIGIIDGPIDTNHPSLRGISIKQYSAHNHNLDFREYIHGTSVASIIAGRRGSMAPAIAPRSRIIAYPVFSYRAEYGNSLTADVKDIAEALNHCVTSGAKIINISAALVGEDNKRQTLLEMALNRAKKAGIIILAAVGNQRTLTGSILTNHTAVIPVISYDLMGQPSKHSPISRQIALRGLGGPGIGVPGIGPGSRQIPMSGTSIATAFITGIAALLYGQFPTSPLEFVKYALLKSPMAKERTVFPPLVNASNAYEILALLNSRYKIQ